MKKFLVFALILMAVSVTGCAKKTLTCDGCGAKVKVAESSNMEESWTVFCEECAKDVEVNK